MFTISTTLPLIIYSIYVPTIFAVYCAQVWIVIANKRKALFRSSYFNLFIVEAFTGLATVCVTTITHRLALFPEVNSFYASFPSNTFTTGLYFMIYYFPGCQEFVKICIALNRLWAIAFFNSYEKSRNLPFSVWSRAVLLCIVAVFGLPFAFYYHLLDVQAYFFLSGNGQTWLVDYDHSVRPWRSNSTLSFYLYLSCSATSLIIYAIALVVLRCISAKNVSSIETRLFLLGFSSFACGLPMTIQQFLYMFAPPDGKQYEMFYRLPWLFDLKTLSPGILSLIFSKAIRDELFCGLKRRPITTVSGIQN